ncbi:MAG: ABC transporter ATP-binding protein [candidate division Zixibacteria bacterium]|nr:ABC transporter ATP-binding protein [candidate division Zixibacteria bacterium]
MTILHAMTIVVQPIMFRNVFDALKLGPESISTYDDFLTQFLVARGWNSAGDLTWAFLVFATLSFLVYVVLQTHRAWMNPRLEMAARQKVFDEIINFGPRFSGKYQTGDVITRLTDDVSEKFSWFACSGIFRFYEAVVLLSLGVAVMMTLNWKLTIITMLPLFLLIFVFRRAGTELVRRYDILQSRISSLNDVMEACFSGIRVVKAYCREKAQSGEFAKVVNQRRDAEVSSVQAQTMVESIYTYVWEIGVALALVAGGYMVVTDQITVGEYLAFDFFIMLMIMPMLDIGQFLVKGLQSAVCIDRLMELQFNRDAAVADGPESLPRTTTGELKFSNVTLSLSAPANNGANGAPNGAGGSGERKRNILNGVSFTVKPGETIALVGKVGSGKTWTMNLIPRLIDPDSGSVSLDGRDLREYQLSDLRRYIGYAPQEALLFSDSIENNIRFGRDWISADDLAWAVDVSQLREEVKTFPNGLQTNVGPRGVTLSGGQKQRVALARALAGRPRILSLDDCSSALDAETEDRLWESLDKIEPKLTRLVITHRTKVLRDSDRILVFDGGKIVESGSHEELMKSGEFYKDIYHRHELEEEV